MARQNGLLVLTIVFLAAAVVFFAASTGGVLFGGASDFADLGVYSVTITLLGFALGCYLLRVARLRNQPEQA